ncbi:MAG: hypothetical protein GVY16_00080 [Planctomycetes bacterium]|jgi:hypothetical protein|nr:hypothetical protein [Planctomycetota bacterium]
MAGDEDLRQQLADRFAKGIRKSFTPCPLIGPKWMQVCPGGKTADFRFVGIRKLAKAIGCSPARILQKIMPNISLDGLGVDVEITDDFTVLMRRTASVAPAAKPKPKRDTSRNARADAPQGPPRPKPKGVGGPNRKKPRTPKPREE